MVLKKGTKLCKVLKIFFMLLFLKKSLAMMQIKTFN